MYMYEHVAKSKMVGYNYSEVTFFRKYAPTLIHSHIIGIRVKV